jgi:V/A-type H+-transporting ATPase subunit B
MQFTELSVSGAARRLEGPLLFLERTVRVGLNSAVEVLGPDGVARVGRVALVDDERLVIEVLESTAGLGLGDTRVRIRNEPLAFGVGPGMLGRIFNSIGTPVDGGPPIPAHEFLPVSGWSINPAARALPRDFIETGISTIDLMNSLVRGQKLPLFSGGGLPHDRMATEIAQRARLLGGEGGGFAVVFVGIGVSHDTAAAFRAAMEESGAISKGLHVLVVMTDMTNYCEALREVSASHGEVPSRKGYPGYMYSDLASIYERAGCIRGLPGTLTQLPILTMPADDIGHPIPDLTGYITEGQIVLDRELDRRGIYPPVRVLPSLSRLMSSGTGKGYTHDDHPALANQLFAAYARATRVRVLASVMGAEGLTDVDRRFLEFGDRFENSLVAQQSGRTLEDSMDIGWKLLGSLPAAELTRLSRKQVEHYLGTTDG